MRLPALDECPMTEECPGYDRERTVCLIRPGDCEFSPAAPDAAHVASAAAPGAATLTSEENA
jgi:hypothetical protein